MEKRKMFSFLAREEYSVEYKTCTGNHCTAANESVHQVDVLDFNQSPQGLAVSCKPYQPSQSTNSPDSLCCLISSMMCRPV